MDIKEIIIDNNLIKYFVEENKVYFYNDSLKCFGIKTNKDFISIFELMMLNNTQFNLFFCSIINVFLVDGLVVNEYSICEDEETLININRKIIHLNEKFMCNSSIKQ